jgi:hypothetical protein
VLIVNAIHHDRGWSPIKHMLALAGELFECDIVPADPREPSKMARISSILRQRIRNGSGDETCLLVCSGPADLWSVLNMGNWRRRFRYLAAWVIDSFWLEHIPRTIRLRNPFDHIFVTSLEDVDQWKSIARVGVTWLPWGTDALRLGRGGGFRDWDLTRVGRQPAEWENDIESSTAAEAFGIKYRGRPDGGALDALQNQKFMMDAYGSTKFTLAFSNVVNRDPNNHPTREYLTGRWVDALACGSTVAGVAPRGANTDQLLWPGATLELGGVGRHAGLRVLAAALAQWSPGLAAKNHEMALKRLDWRLRFKDLAKLYDIRSPRLTTELGLLDERIAALIDTESIRNV